KVHSQVYLAGESYAGVYIPYFAEAMLKWGNGWIDPLRQYDSYTDFSLQNNLVSGRFLDSMIADTRQCREEYSKGAERLKVDVCEDILNQVLAQSRSSDGLCLNVYDIRLKDDTATGVIEAIHATGKSSPWIECDNAVYEGLRDDDTLPSYTILPDLLTKLRVLVFVGDKDLICNNLGLEYMIDNLTWNGAKGFTVRPLEWLINDRIVGLNQTERNLTYVRIFGGSHMPAVESPEQMFEMMNRFMGIEVNRASQSNDTWLPTTPDSRARKVYTA
ncbi:Cell death protease, partial [Gonapodya sp. JEL0774]